MIFKRRVTRRSIQIALGLLWLLDGLFQLQPQMFTSNFSTYVISPATVGQPIFVTGPIHLFIHIFLFHPAIFNSFAAITQLALGALILWRKTTKLGLLGSIGWGLFVWVIGEGYGGLLGWHTLILMGAPGAALLYAVLAVAVFPQSKDKTSKQDLDKPAIWLPFVWAILWILGAIYQLLPGQNSVSDLSSMLISNSQSGQPGWLASLDLHVSNIINGFGATTTSMTNMHMNASQMAMMQTHGQASYWFIILLALIQAFIGIGIFLPNIYRNLSIMIGVIISLVFWVIGQSFGGIFTGLATDPNTAILYILLGLAILGCNDPNKYFTKLLNKVEAKIA